jgi:thioredoxin 1
MSITTIIVLAIITAIAAYFWYATKKMKNMPMVEENEHVITLTSANMPHQIKDGLSLVDFWAAWCMPCKMMAPVINDVAQESAGKAKICKLDIQAYQDMAAKYSVRSIPTMILFKDGKEINRFVGVKSKDFLMKELNKVI